MHLLDRSGQITGTRGQLARLGRCTAVQVESALQDLIRTKAADVTMRVSQNVTPGHKLVTVTNRRMRREWKSRNGATLRKQAQRARQPCHAQVTAHSHNSEVRSQNKGESVSTFEAQRRSENSGPPSLERVEGWKLRKDLRETTDPAERGRIEAEMKRRQQAGRKPPAPKPAPPERPKPEPMPLEKARELWEKAKQQANQ
jgi:hypothetical protein